MREFKEVRKDLGDDADASAPYIGQARTLLGVLKNRMRQGGLGSLSQTTQLPDGTVITVASIMGQDAVHIAPSTTPPAPRPQFEPPTIALTPYEPQYTVPELELYEPEIVPGDTEAYSDIYLSHVLLGAASDKTGNFAYIALAQPFVDQSYAMYDITQFANNSQLIKLGRGMKEASRTPIAMPDWGGQLTYDFATNTFYMNAWTPADTRYQSNSSVYQGHVSDTFHPVAHRSLVQIGADGSQSAMAEPFMAGVTNFSAAYLWGSGEWWAGASQFGLSPADKTLFGSYWAVSQGFGNHARGTTRYTQQFPLSQPSVNGLIAVMFPGATDFSLVGEGWTDMDDVQGYAFLFSTVNQSIVWSGKGLGTFWGTWVDGFTGFNPSSRFEPRAITTATGDAYLWRNGQIMPVTISGKTQVGAPPDGTTDIAVTKTGTQAFAIAAGVLQRFRAGSWTPVTLAGTGNPLMLLHDIVTDAVACVMDDGSGAWIFNGTSKTGQAVPTYKFRFGRPPSVDPKMIFPTQFINGALFITYALPWDGTSAQGSLGSGAMPNLGVFQEQDYFATPTPHGMTAHYLDAQQSPKWRAQAGRTGGYTDPGNGLVYPWILECGTDASCDPTRWVIGRYDVAQLQV
jgi:hypothetical protein